MIRATIKSNKKIIDVISLAKHLKISPLKINHYKKQGDYITIYINQTI